MDLNELIADALRTQAKGLSDETIDELTQRIAQYIESQAELKSVPFRLLTQGVYQASPTIQLMLANQGSSIQDAAQYAFKFVINQVVDDPSSTIPESHWGESYCPYPGLEAFTKATAEYYCGRDEEIEKFLRQIDRPILALTGSSGVGKSSFVSAGVLPRLRERFQETAVFLTFRIHSNVNWLYDFAESLGQEIGKPGDHILDALRKRENALITILKDAYLKENKRVFLIFDQFETLFVGEEKSKKDRQCFLGNLLSIETHQESMFLTTIIASRENFFEDPDYISRPRLGDIIQRENISLLALNDQQLRQAVEQPLNKYNQQHGLTLKFQLGLVDLLIREFRNPSVSLPLVQYLLRLLWTEKHHLTHFAYNSLGGLERVLDRHALGIYQGFADEDQKLVKAILIALVRPGISGEYTRKRIDRQKLFVGRAPQEQRRIEQILNRLSSTHSRILSEQQIRNTVYLELTHEVILRQWSLLQDLIEVRKERIEARERLLPKAEVWWASRTTKGGLGNTGELYIGNEFTRARQYLENASYSEDIDGTISACYKASRQYQRQKLTRTVTFSMGFFSCCCVIFASLTILAVIQGQRASDALQLGATAESHAGIEASQRATAEAEEARQASISDASSLASQALGAIGSNPENALLYAIQSVYATYEDYGMVISEADVALFRVLVTSPFLYKFDAHNGLSFYSVLYNPQGTHILTYGGTEAKLWDTAGNLRVNLLGHQDTINSAVFSSNSSLIATASNDGNIRLWDIDGILLAAFDSLLINPSIVGFTQDEVALLIVGSNGTANLWDLDGNLIFAISDLADTPHSIGFDPVGQHIVIATTEGDAKLLNLDGEVVTSFRSSTGSVKAVTIGPDGNKVVTLNSAQIIEVWNIDGVRETEVVTNVELNYALLAPGDERIIGISDELVGLWNITGQLINIIRGHGSFIGSVVLSEDGSQIATTGEDNTGKLWNMNGELLATLGHEFTFGRDRVHPVYAADYSPGGTRIATIGMDGAVYVWNAASGRVSSVRGHQSPIETVSFQPNGQLYVTAGEDQRANIWRNDQLVVSLQSHSDLIQSVQFSPDGMTVATASNDGSVRLWDLSGKQISILQGHTDWVFSANFSPDGAYILTSSRDGTARLWDLDGNQLVVFDGHTGPVISAEFNPSGDTIITSGADHLGNIWGIDGSLLYTLSYSEEYLVGISASFSPDGNTVLTACGLDCDKAALWTPQGELISILEGHTHWVFSASFSPSGERIVTSSRDATAILWDQGGNLIKPLTGHTSWVTWAGFDPTGTRIATIGLDGAIRLWNSSGDLLVVLPGHSGAINAAGFSPDGRFLVTVGDDGYVKLWQVYTDIDLMLQEAIQRLLAFMTAEECAEYFGTVACSS